MICRILQRLELTEAECTLIVLLWITKPWYTKLLHLLIDTPVLLPIRKNLVTRPLTGKVHPTLYKTRFLACSCPENSANTRNSWQNSRHYSICMDIRNVYVKRWVLYCCQRGQDLLQPTVIAVLQFLTLLYEEGKEYSSLNIARCAVSTLFLEKDTVGSPHTSANFCEAFSTGALLCPGTM